jgi:hypothetical protein
VSGTENSARLFSLKGAVNMNTANLTSPMNPEHLNDTVIGIDVLALAELRTALDARPPGLSDLPRPV